VTRLPIALSTDDRFLPTEYAVQFPKPPANACLEWIEGTGTFSPEDRPELLVQLIRSFGRLPTAALRVRFLVSEQNAAAAHT
jgi:hypothetical protein